MSSTAFDFSAARGNAGGGWAATGEEDSGWVIRETVIDLSEAETCLKSSMMPFNMTTNSSTLLVRFSILSLSSLMSLLPFKSLILGAFINCF
jgi:hypothetical protein